MTSWPHNRARTYLDAAANGVAARVGADDVALDRLAALVVPSAASSEGAFRAALRAAGWRRDRRDRAVAVVTAEPAPVRVLRQIAWVLGARAA